MIRSKRLPRKTEIEKARNCEWYEIADSLEILKSGVSMLRPHEAKKGSTYYECLTEDKLTKLYLDIERDDYTYEPDETYLKSIKEACVSKISSWSETDEGFDAKEHIAIAEAGSCPRTTKICEYIKKRE